MFHFIGMTRRIAAFTAVGVLFAGCAFQDHETLDVRPSTMAPVRTIAIATIAARPSVAQPLFDGNRGELVGLLGKFETELSNALVNKGFNVVNIAQSGLIYNSANLEYEIGYLHNTEDFMAKARGEDQVHAEARRLRAYSNKLRGDRLDKTPFKLPTDVVDQITSPNTRIFPEIGLNYRFNPPRLTENGGALDNRFMSDAARMSIGEITRDMGAEAYILIDTNIVLSARKEGYILSGLTGGTRYATVDGTAILVRNDGAIINVDRLRNQSIIPMGGFNQESPTTERTGRGIPGFHNQPDQYNLLEGAYQAIRFTAVELADRYAAYRADGIEQTKAK